MGKMKKIVIFYFSGTGNTWWVSETMARLFRERGIKTDALSIEKIPDNISDNDLLAVLKNYDCIGFGYPVYGSDVPEIMKDFMRKISDINSAAKMPASTPVEVHIRHAAKLPAFVFCTQWKFSGDGARTGATFLKRQFYIKWAEHFYMPNNVCVSVIPLPYTTDIAKISEVLSKAERRIIRFVEIILKGKTYLRGFTIFSLLAGSIQRVPFRLFFDKFRNDISINKDKCIRCNKCVRMCPSGNLVIKKLTDDEPITNNLITNDLTAGDSVVNEPAVDELAVNRRNPEVIDSERTEIATNACCIICLRCYDFCPMCAIKYMKRGHKEKRGKPYTGPIEGFDPEDLKKRTNQ